jgi:hypothetical protein
MEHTVAARRQVAIVVGALVAGAFEAAHTLAYSNQVAGWPVAFTTATTLVDLEALTFALDRGLRRWRSPAASIAVAVVVAVGAGVAQALGGAALQRVIDVPLLGRAAELGSVVVAQIGAFDGLVALGIWAMAVVVPFAVRDANARAREAEQLRTAAELARLRAHLQPHFLLNTLTTIAGLTGEDPREARNLIGALGDLLRDSLEDASDMQTLDDEVRWLKRYAEILETRHRGSIRFSWDIEEASRGLRVPRLLLQPLVENAVKHGALRRREGGEVAVRTHVHLTRLICIVEDNGPGPSDRRAGALGLDLVTRRLALEYAGAAAFRLEADGGRTRSIVEIPTEALR